MARPGVAWLGGVTARRGRAGNTPTTGEADDTFVDRRSVKVGTSWVMRTRAIFSRLVFDDRSRARPRGRGLFQHQAVGRDRLARTSALATTGRSAAGCSVDSRRRSPKAADRAQGVAGQGLAWPIRAGRLAALAKAWHMARLGVAGQSEGHGKAGYGLVWRGTARRGRAGSGAGHGRARHGLAWLGMARQGVAFLPRRQNNRAPRVVSRLWRRAGVIKVCSPGAGRFGAEFLRKGNKDA